MTDPTAGDGAAPVPLFELDGVSLVLDGRRILDDVSLRIPDNVITVIVGPSGAGKSTILRLLNRLEVPTSGEIRFRGRPLDELDPLVLRRRVGMVFQQPTPFPGTVRDNLLVADPSAGEDELTEVLAVAGLPASFLDREADELSGGESQRMCLARTLLTRPEVLLMDEPTSALDPDAQARLERTAAEVAAAGRPMVWVTHDLGQAERLGSEIVALVDGRVADVAERDRFLHRERGGTADHADRPDTASQPDHETPDRATSGVATDRVRNDEEGRHG